MRVRAINAKPFDPFSTPSPTLEFVMSSGYESYKPASIENVYGLLWD